jgi:hypothetical protein
MNIVPIDQQLFCVQNFAPPALVDKILNTNWVALSYQRTQFRKDGTPWLRRQIDSSAIEWHAEWVEFLKTKWEQITQQLGPSGWPYPTYPESTFWLDEPGFDCGIHTDGELPGAMQLYWIGNSNLGTTFYHNKNGKNIRVQFKFVANQGYVMINLPDHHGYQLLQWHGMLTPVPKDTFRLSSYVWPTRIY